MMYMPDCFFSRRRGIVTLNAPFPTIEGEDTANKELLKGEERIL